MAFQEPKRKQSVIWGGAPYGELPPHYQPLLDHRVPAGAVRRRLGQPRIQLIELTNQH
jgi:hypothetical protein